MDQIEFSIDINASRETVWEVLWNDDTFRAWTSVFSDEAEGARLESEWREGARFEFTR